jgi:hypothetical protein
MFINIGKVNFVSKRELILVILIELIFKNETMKIYFFIYMLTLGLVSTTTSIRNQVETVIDSDMYKDIEERILFKTLLALAHDHEYLTLGHSLKTRVIHGFEELANQRGIKSKRIGHLILRVKIQAHQQKWNSIFYS